ncbi:MAG: molecular chaperone DnaJ [Thermoleophilia bacterium]
MSTPRDYYETLGVSSDASDDEIKKAFRNLARQHHPDVNPDNPEAAETFRVVAEAYEVLSVTETRVQYDRFGHAGISGAGGGGGAGFGNLDDILGMFFGDGMFGGRGARRGPQAGPDAATAISLTLREAAVGVQRDLEVEIVAPCERCSGSGAEPPTRPIPCPTCGGLGQVRQISNTPLGQIVREMPCPACRGRGATVETPCSDCRGQGKQPERRTVSVGIPAGVDTGQRVRVVGQGHAGDAGAPAGDLYVAIQIEDDPAIEREGLDLHVLVDLTVTQAMLGATVHVPTLEGTETIVLQSGTQPGDRRTLRGKGMPQIGNENRRGDLHVLFAVHIPKKLEPTARLLVEELDKAIPEDAYKTESGFFNRVRRGFSGG